MRTVTRNMGPNICTVTHDANGIMIKEQCTGTTSSTTIVTVSATQTICKERIGGKSVVVTDL